MWKILWMLLAVLDLSLGFTVPTTLRAHVATRSDSLVSSDTAPHSSRASRASRRQRIPSLRSYKSPGEASAYNDDGFGLVFLGAAALEQDVEFCATFGVLSAVAAACTYAGKIEKDERAPAAVAVASLVVTPFVAAIASGVGVAPPATTEIGLCAVSAAWAFFNWSRTKNEG